MEAHLGVSGWRQLPGNSRDGRAAAAGSHLPKQRGRHRAAAPPGTESGGSSRSFEPSERVCKREFLAKLGLERCKGAELRASLHTRARRFNRQGSTGRGELESWGAANALQSEP